MIDCIEKLKQDFKKAGFDVDAPAFAFHFDDFKKSPLSTFIPLFTRLLHDVRQGGTIAVDDIEKVPYFKDIAKELDDKAIEIISFFEFLNKKKTKIVFWDDIDAYKEHLKKHNDLYRSDICADPMDNNINALTLDAAHKTDVYKDMTLEQLRQNISHEFVHVCQNSLEEETVDDRNAWFCEALATNLGNPEQFGKLIYIDGICIFP